MISVDLGAQEERRRPKVRAGPWARQRARTRVDIDARHTPWVLSAPRRGLLFTRDRTLHTRSDPRTRRSHQDSPDLAPISHWDHPPSIGLPVLSPIHRPPGPIFDRTGILHTIRHAPGPRGGHQHDISTTLAHASAKHASEGSRSWDLVALNCPASMSAHATRGGAALGIAACDTRGSYSPYSARVALLPASSRHASYRATSAPSHTTALAPRTPCHLPFSANTSLNPPALSLAFGHAPPMHGTSQC